MKKYKNIIIVPVITVILLGVSVFVSMYKFDTLNPIKSGVGFAKIVFTDMEIIQIQDYPKIYLAKPDKTEQTLINFMKSRGYNYSEGERMGSLLVFENEVSKNYIQFSVNSYYSKWIFNE